MRFAPAPEYEVFPHAASGRSSPTRRRCGPRARPQPLIEELDPDAVVADILTVAGALAAQMEERPWATLVPHVLPDRASRGLPPYSIGRAAAAHAGSARGCGRCSTRCCAAARSGAARELNGARERVGLPPLDHVHGGISRAAGARRHLPAARVPAHDVASRGCG